jgi:hypothetical protein
MLTVVDIALFGREKISARKGAKAQRKTLETRQRFAPLREKYSAESKT